MRFQRLEPIAAKFSFDKVSTTVYTVEYHEGEQTVETEAA